MERVLERPGPQWPGSISPDGTTLTFSEYVPDTQGDIYLQNRVDDYDAHIISMSVILKF